MPGVFLDANIFFAAVASQEGGSYFIIKLAKKKKVKIITVVYALAEAERNIQKKLDRAALEKHYQNLISIRPVIQSLFWLPQEIEAKLKLCLPEKDIPILAGAILSNAEVLITLDKMHFLKNEKLSSLNLPITIMNPGDFLQKYFL